MVERSVARQTNRMACSAWRYSIDADFVLPKIENGKIPDDVTDTDTTT